MKKLILILLLLLSIDIYAQDTLKISKIYIHTIPDDLFGFERLDSTTNVNIIIFKSRLYYCKQKMKYSIVRDVYNNRIYYYCYNGSKQFYFLK